MRIILSLLLYKIHFSRFIHVYISYNLIIQLVNHEWFERNYLILNLILPLNFNLFETHYLIHSNDE